MVNSTLFWALKGMDSKLSMTTQQNNSTLQQQDEGLWSLSKKFMWNFLNEKYKGVEGAEEKFKMINEKHEAFTTPQITLKEFFEV
ncbi:3714_t:CDS:2 [Rhizophagus irregularis]|nr:3714_t:CDS:2 [Rhizophagus irregularis]